jgi:hypothetical protein
MSILAKLLTESEAYDPEYGGGLCNHLPLALTALDQMGATPGQLNDYRRTHASWLEKLPEREAAPAVPGRSARRTMRALSICRPISGSASRARAGRWYCGRRCLSWRPAFPRRRFMG